MTREQSAGEVFADGMKGLEAVTAALVAEKRARAERDEMIRELCDELSLYGRGIQEHARCHIILELVTKGRAFADAERRQKEDGR